MIQVNFANLNINNVQDGSGIYSGSNIANGWTTIHKENSGFGSVSNAIIVNNLSYVYDNDFIDSPIDDRDVYLCPNYPDERDINVDFQSINVNSLINNSSIAIGENNQVGWNGHSKRNHGNGSFTGKSLHANYSTSVEDNDFIDAPINDQDYKPGYMNQSY
ncbi:hypothetical protein JCM9140_818 [Halalkalibacter wakoensis JCM 9140]|uniref:Uncharacterized protein n=1 Tax=Halalkalibacter wakoensis JCM 9140 TaxID=1236970 RepID=W4PZE8_9BACI|nr:spore germination protein [Halalkalibacter wakoensis]GAE24858.1 hypothetical protein JCM9140_818 [Halalkalibacter wakoensis JCM 9140]